MRTSHPPLPPTPSSFNIPCSTFDIRLLFIGTLLLFAASQAMAGDAFWPQFHGPNRDNISTETGLLKQWPEEGPKLLWTAEGLGHGFSSVSIARGMIYTAGNIDDDTVITAMDMGGRILWQVKNGAAWTKSYAGTRGTPTIDGDRLYHESPLGEVVCLNAKTGKRVWGLNILEKFFGRNTRWALAESLLIDGVRVICCPGGEKTTMVALDKMTGRTVWKCRGTDDLAGYASAVLAEYKGLRIILTLTSKAMIGVNADGGDLLWREGHVSMFDENVLRPLYHDGQVFVSSLSAGSVKWKINVRGKKASVEEVWRCKEMDNHHGGVILLDGYLYGSSCLYNGSRWICLDWKTGEKKYAERGVGKGSLTYADGMLYTLGERGKMGIVKPTPSGHEVVGQFKIPDGGEGRSWAHPVVCAGRLYIRHGEFLYVYDVRAKK